MRKRTLTAMLTLLASGAAIVALAGCGGKSGSSHSETTNGGTTTSGVHKQPSHPPAY